MIIQEDAEFLEHFGVKGMHWGVHKVESAVQKTVKSVKRNHELNKASRAREARRLAKPPDNLGKSPSIFSKNHVKTVETARFEVNSGNAKKRLRMAKKQYKLDKQKIGSKEARKILRTHKNTYYSTVSKAREAKNGRELVDQILTDAAQSADRARRLRESEARTAAAKKQYEIN